MFCDILCKWEYVDVNGRGLAWMIDEPNYDAPFHSESKFLST